MNSDYSPSSFKLGTGMEVATSHVPFFITGSGRCGTTLMRRLISERTATVIPPENYALGISNRFLSVAHVNWDDCCNEIFDDFERHQESWKMFNLDRNETLALLQTVPEEHRSIPNFWYAFHAIYAAKLGKPSTTSWGDKTPINANRLRNVVQIFPKAKFVFMVRDVFDVAYSYGSMGVRKRRGQYLDGAKRWVRAYSSILRFVARRPDQSMMVYYEKLVRESDTTLKSSLKFLGLPEAAPITLSKAETYDMSKWPHLRNALKDVKEDSVGKGRLHLERAVKEEISSIAATLQAHFGYEPTGQSLG